MVAKLRYKKVIKWAKARMKLSKKYYDHNIEHIKDVVNFCKKICGKLKTENIDRNLIIMCAFCHDVGRGNPEHEQVGATMTYEEMKKNGFDEATCMLCQQAIIDHAWLSNPQSIYGKILKDADKLAYIGLKRWKEMDKHNYKSDGLTNRIPTLREHLLLEESKQIFDIEYKKFVNFISKSKNFKYLLKNLYINKIEPLKHNKKFVVSNFGKTFYNMVQNCSVDLKEINEANTKLQMLLYGKEFTNQLYSNTNKLLEENLELVSSYSKKWNNVSESDLKNLSLVVVRPESFDKRYKIKKYLQKKGLNVILSKKVAINFNQYRVLYPYGTTSVEAQTQFPTRTLCYINHPCYAIVLFGEHEKFGEDYLTNYVCKLKGKPGLIKKDTIRYEFCYKKFNKIISKGKIDKYLKFLDPIGVYRAIIHEKIECKDPAYLQADNKLINLVGQCIHVPDNTEIKKDICAVLSTQDIFKIENYLLKLK